MKLEDLIVPILLGNTDEYNHFGNVNFQTRDMVYLSSSQYCFDEEKCFPTDYAILNQAFGDLAEENLISALTKNQNQETYEPCRLWLRSGFPSIYAYNRENKVAVLNDQGEVFCANAYERRLPHALRPNMVLDINAYLAVRKALESDVRYRNVKSFKISNCNDKFHFMELGEFPDQYVGAKLNDHLEQAFEKRAIVPTGKTYTGCFEKKNTKPNYYNEYELDGKKYVRINKGYHNNGYWVEVKPIMWEIKNWEELPQSINPNGTGSTKGIILRTLNAVMAGIPFYPNQQDQNITLWQNSTIRGFLNGYNVNNLIENGNVKYPAPNGGDFKKYNFINQAFSKEIEIISQIDKNALQNNQKRKGWGVQVVEEPMTVDEQIQFYVQNGKSFMLHGPSGIGKTRRIEEVDPDYVSITLRNGILPEEVIGKNIYPNNDKTQAGIWVPPYWYADLCKKCQQEPNQNHVLFIDEITNVKPNEQSLVYHIVLNRAIGPNVGQLPDNVVVAAAGNSIDESEAAYNMPEPLFRRFDGHIELKPDIQQWLEWGSKNSLKHQGQLRVHPLVASFVGTYGDSVFYSPYDAENPPKYAIDPRGWEKVSDLIYANHGVLRKELLENKVGKSIATSLMEYAKILPITVEDVVTENYHYNEIPTKFDAKYALALSLRFAKIDEIKLVRNFIREHLGAEILKMFDVAWVGNDDEKALHLKAIQIAEDNQILRGNSNDNDKAKA